MGNTIKKFSAIGLSLVTAISLSGAVMVLPALGATTDELQAQITALLAQIQALQAQLTTAPAVSSFNFTKDLTLGSKGADVKELQKFLNAKGYAVAASGAGSTGNETTTFGSLTKAALAKYQAAVGISPAVGYFGPKSRAYVASLAAAPTTPTTPTTPTVPTTGLVLALASDNPAGTIMPKGVSGAEFVKFTVSGKGTITGLTFKRKGIGATADFASTGFYLYEGNTRLTSGRSINSTTHEVSFLNLALAINGTKTLSLKADVSSSASVGNIHYFELVSATGDSTPTGALVSNTMTIGGQQVGGVVATSTGSLSNPYIGQLIAQVSEFKLTASSTEDVLIKQLALTQGGSISNSNLSNFVLKDTSGNVLAKAASVGAKDLVTFVFDTAYLLEKGQERTFRVYVDVAGASKSSDTIKLYFDSKGDIVATGKTYGYSVDPDIVAFDTAAEAHAITLAGGDVTITFNGPMTGDVAIRGQDVEVYNFTIASKNNIEIRNLRFSTTTTGTIAIYNDAKVWDTSSNSVITSATNLTTTNFTYTDIINISAGASKTFKVTVDVDSTNSADGTIKINLLAFTASDIKNLDNNQFVATANIVPASIIVGNAQTVKSPTLDVQLASTPSSQTYVQGAPSKNLAGFSFRAISSDIKLSTVKVTATSSSGTLTSGEVQSLGLYDGATLVSTVKSLDSSALTATFDNLNITIAKGVTKVLTLKGSISANATDGDVYYFNIAAVSSANITANDADGNSATLTGTAANSGGTVSHTITTSGDVSVVVAPDDVDSEAGIVTAGTESVLGKFRFTSTNEDMTVNKMRILVAASDSATATTTATADDAPTIKLYDGVTPVGAAAGYTVNASGDNAGIAIVEGLGWVIPKDSNKTLTVKGVLNSISAGADTGTSVYVSVMGTSGTTFEAVGSTAKDNAVTAATGKQKVVYKTKPTFAAPTATTEKLATGQKAVMKFKIKADGLETVAWKQIQFKVSMTGATMSAVDAVPGTTGNVALKEVSTGSNLSLASAFSGTSTTTGEQVKIAGGSTGYVSLLLTSAQEIATGVEKEYELQLTFADVSATVGAASAQVNLHRTETTLVTATTVAGVRGSLGTATDAAPSFVWSDYSVVGHSESTADWANGVLVKILPSSSITISN